MKLVLTCEHAGNKIPNKYQHLFNKVKKVLNSHRGYDFGAYKLFNKLSPQSDFSKYTQISRLLIDCNRSLGNKNLYSENTKFLPKELKDEIYQNYYFPYRTKVENFINTNIEKEKIIHLSVHTFIPVLNGKIRNADVGILYDPKSIKEKFLAKKIKCAIRSFSPNLKIRYNYPYLGISDGFTTYLRNKYSYIKYKGIELEVNQKLFKNKKTINKIILSMQKFMIEMKKMN